METSEISLHLPQILVDSMPFGVIITDSNLLLVQANHWVFSHTKIDSQASLGRALGEVFPELASRNLIEAYNLVMQGGVPLTLSNRIHRFFLRIASRQPALGEMPQNATIIPMRSEGKMVGTITFINDLTERISIENSLKREVEKLSALHEIDRAISTLDLDECLRVIVRYTRTLFQGKSAVLFLYDQDKLQIAANDSQGQFALIPSEMAKWVGANRKNHLSSNLKPFQRPPSDKSSYINLHTEDGLSEMATPLIVHELCIGVLDVQTDPTHLYEMQDIELLEAIASRAAISIHNARLHASERAQRQLAQSMHEISMTLAAELDLEAVLDTILKSVARVVPYDAACILLLDNNRLQVSRYRGFGLPNAPETQTLLELNFENSRLIDLMEKSHLPEVHYGSDLNGQDLPFGQNDHINTWAGAPIVLSGKLLGFLVLGKNEPLAYNLDSASNLAIFACSAGIALENARSYSQQQILAITDGLTGLNNRRFFDEELNRELERVARFQRPSSLIMLDIDNFKDFNDSHGHQAGDELLKYLAKVMRKQTREIDIVARYGGEEFAIIVPEVGLEGAVLIAERIRLGMQGRISLDETDHSPVYFASVTISLGVASAPSHAQEPAELIHAADSALYISKRNGKNQTVIFDDSRVFY